MATPGNSAKPPCLCFAELNALFQRAAQLGGKAGAGSQGLPGLQASYFLSSVKNRKIQAAENSRSHAGFLFSNISVPQNHGKLLQTLTSRNQAPEGCHSANLG